MALLTLDDDRWANLGCPVGKMDQGFHDETTVKKAQCIL
jgi:hypothetical protein